MQKWFAFSTWPRMCWMVSRSFHLASLGVEMGKEHPSLRVSLWGKHSLGYSREQEVLEHEEGSWRHPRRVWSVARVIDFILTSSRAAPRYRALLGFPTEVRREEVGKHLVVCNSPIRTYFWWGLGPIQAKMELSDPFLLLCEGVMELSITCTTRCKGNHPETFPQLPSSTRKTQFLFDCCALVFTFICPPSLSLSGSEYPHLCFSSWFLCLVVF